MAGFRSKNRCGIVKRQNFSRKHQKKKIVFNSNKTPPRISLLLYLLLIRFFSKRVFHKSFPISLYHTLSNSVNRLKINTLRVVLSTIPHYTTMAFFGHIGRLFGYFWHDYCIKCYIVMWITNCPHARINM